MLSDLYFPPNQGWTRPIGEENGYGYISPQMPVYSQLPAHQQSVIPPTVRPAGYLPSFGYPFYPFNGGMYPNYEQFPQKPFRPNYLQLYDTLHG